MPLLDVDGVDEAALLLHLEGPLDRTAQQLHPRLEALEPAHAHVRAVQDHARLEGQGLEEQLDEEVAHPVRALRPGLQDQGRAIAIHDQAGQPLGVPAHQPAGPGRVHEAELGPRVDGALDPGEPELAVGLLLRTGDHAQGDLRLGAEEGPAERLPLGGEHRDELSGGALPIGDVVGVDPGVATEQPPPPLAREGHRSHRSLRRLPRPTPRRPGSSPAGYSTRALKRESSRSEARSGSWAAQSFWRRSAPGEEDRGSRSRSSQASAASVSPRSAWVQARL